MSVYINLSKKIFLPISLMLLSIFFSCIPGEIELIGIEEEDIDSSRYIALMPDERGSTLMEYGCPYNFDDALSGSVELLKAESFVITDASGGQICVFRISSQTPGRYKLRVNINADTEATFSLGKENVTPSYLNNYELFSFLNPGEEFLSSSIYLDENRYRYFWIHIVFSTQNSCGNNHCGFTVALEDSGLPLNCSTDFFFSLLNAREMVPGETVTENNASPGEYCAYRISDDFTAGYYHLQSAPDFNTLSHLYLSGEGATPVSTGDYEISDTPGVKGEIAEIFDVLVAPGDIRYSWVYINGTGSLCEIENCSFAYNFIPEDPLLADLVPISIISTTLPLVAQTPFNINYTIKNAGSADTSGPFEIKFLLSESSSYCYDFMDSIDIGSVTVSDTIAASDSFSGSILLTVPAEIIDTSKAYYPCMKIDSVNSITERNESNNLLTGEQSLIFSLPADYRTYYIKFFDNQATCTVASKIYTNLKDSGATKSYLFKIFDLVLDGNPTIKVNLKKGSTYKLLVSDVYSSPTARYSVKWSDNPVLETSSSGAPGCPDSYEDDDNFSTAKPLLLNVSQDHTIDVPSENDWFSLAVPF